MSLTLTQRHSQTSQATSSLFNRNHNSKTQFHIVSDLYKRKNSKTQIKTHHRLPSPDSNLRHQIYLEFESLRNICQKMVNLQYLQKNKIVYLNRMIEIIQQIQFSDCLKILEDIQLEVSTLLRHPHSCKTVPILLRRLLDSISQCLKLEKKFKFQRTYSFRENQRNLYCAFKQFQSMFSRSPKAKATSFDQIYKSLVNKRVNPREWIFQSSQIYL